MRVEFINEARRENNLSETEHFFLGTDAPQARLNASYIRFLCACLKTPQTNTSCSTQPP